MRYSDSYSRWVAFFKVLLPLAALAILSTLFLLSKSSDPNATIPFSDAEIAERIRDQQITAPRFAGTTERGDEVYLSATKAVPGGGDNPGQAEDLSAQIKLAAGGVVTLHAERGWVNVPDDAASFRGRVTIETDTGYRLVTERLDSAVKRIDMRAPGVVTGTGPLGRLNAGAMQITAPDNNADATHLVFTDGVNLLYDPQPTER